MTKTETTMEPKQELSRMVRIREPVAALLYKLAEIKGTTFPVEVNRAAVLLLRQEGLLETPR